MSKKGVEGNFFLGVVSKVLGNTDSEKIEYKIEADIPGVIKGINAYPIRECLDEPKVGDPIILLGLDPDYNSYYLYWKLKENDFTGFRSSGKEISITPDEMVLRVYKEPDPENNKYKDNNKEPDILRSEVRMDKDGNIKVQAIGDGAARVEVNVTGKTTVNIGGECSVTIGGSADVNIGGSANIEVGGQTTVKSPNITLEGGTIKVKGSSFGVGGSAPGSSGPFNCLGACLFTGAPHGGGSVDGPTGG